MDIKETFLKWRVLMLVFFIAASLLMIQPSFFRDGVAIRSIEKDSPAALAGMHSPLGKDKPMFREIIVNINDYEIASLDDYAAALSSLVDGDVVKISTQSRYSYENNKRQMHIFAQDVSYTLYYNQTTGFGIEVYDAPTSNLKKGLDLQGGTRVLLQPESEVSQDDMSLIIQNLQQRLNVYGLSDLVITQANDLDGNQYILVEIAGVTQDEIQELIASQGKFEAKIGNDTVFNGGQDITYVCRSAECSFVVDPRRPCTGSLSSGYMCSFSFSISLSQDAAERQAALTTDIPLSTEGDYLASDLDLYLDDELVDTLKIGSDLKGRAVTDIAISGPGIGATYQEAVQNSALNMKKLQTILITGSLPVKLNVVKVDTISPAVGEEFIKNIMLVMLYSIVAVGIVLGIRYRHAAIITLIMFTMIAEVIIILGVASFIGWNLDLVSIAGILVAVGTGVDHQIVITDEVYGRKRKELILSWKEKLKRAFVIIMAAYFTTVVAMLPLFWAGAGALKGFALTSILGVTIGVFITRPAFAVLVEAVLKKGEE
jgi:preprotein translocase subunit SecD